MSMIELALPAGSLQSALVAFENGADAVYLGLQSFSARKGATNFSFEDIGRLKTSLTKNQKFYVTVNTLATDHEMPQVESMLRRLALYEPDGVIVQDLGIAKMIKTQYLDRLLLHGSTQLAVHTVSGVQSMASLGFSRVVLSRELTIDEIAAIRTACPDIELKVFIHGALCYGFSGLCMASDILVGRSANRGECAQICRTWFTRTDTSKSGNYFSMTDLDIGTAVRTLDQIGINSLKIEGRMKSPAYVGAVTRYYRLLLDRRNDSSAIEQARKEAHIIFSRERSAGWLSSYGRTNKSDSRRGPRLSTVSYPSHTGIAIGEIEETRTNRTEMVAKLRLYGPIALHDGLLIRKAESSGIDTPVKFGLGKLWDVHGKSLTDSQHLSHVYILLPESVDIEPGTPIYMISKHDQEIPLISEKALTPYREPMDIECLIGNNIIELHSSTFFDPSITQRYQIDIGIANTPQNTIDNVLKIFASSGSSLFTLGTLSVRHTNNGTFEHVFLPLSQLKQIRRQWYAHIDQLYDRWCSVQPPRTTKTTGHTPWEQLPARTMIIPPGERGIIWVDIVKALVASEHGLNILDYISMVDNKLYIPLQPVMFEEELFVQSLNKLVKDLSSAYGKTNLRLGLNNVAHIKWAENNPDIPCFADVYLYMSNSLAVDILVERLPNLVGLYRWVEHPATELTEYRETASPVGKDFNMPLFISRSCFRYDSLGLSCDNCPRRGSWELEQTGKRFLVEVRDCLTVVSLLP